jgi:hypothetical protein
VPSLDATNRADDAYVGDAAIVETDVRCEENDITDFCIEMGGKGFWRYSPTVETSIWKCS